MEKAGLDITSEEFREYHYDGGRVFRVEQPTALHITADGSHRVITADGRTCRPERGFVGISWKPKPGKPPFVA